VNRSELPAVYSSYDEWGKEAVEIDISGVRQLFLDDFHKLLAKPSAARFPQA